MLNLSVMGGSIADFAHNAPSVRSLGEEKHGASNRLLRSGQGHDHLPHIFSVDDRYAHAAQQVRKSHGHVAKATKGLHPLQSIQERGHVGFRVVKVGGNPEAQGAQGHDDLLGCQGLR